MSTKVKCPTCGMTGFDLLDYRSMMVLSIDEALFTLTCPRCGTVVSAVCEIPDSLRDDVLVAAHELDAGMGRDA